MARMVALRDLVGTGYQASPGQQFKCSDEVAESLASRGLAEYFFDDQPRAATYETKVIIPAVAAAAGRLQVPIKSK